MKYKKGDIVTPTLKGLGLSGKLTPHTQGTIISSIYGGAMMRVDWKGFDMEGLDHWIMYLDEIQHVEGPW